MNILCHILHTSICKRQHPTVLGTVSIRLPRSPDFDDTLIKFINQPLILHPLHPCLRSRGWAFMSFVVGIYTHLQNPPTIPTARPPYFRCQGTSSRGTLSWPGRAINPANLSAKDCERKKRAQNLCLKVSTNQINKDFHEKNPTLYRSPNKQC